MSNSENRLPVGLVYDPMYLKHETPYGHPERPERLNSINSWLASYGMSEKLLRIAPRAASVETVALVHSKAYIAVVEEDTRSGLDTLSTGDTALCRDSYEVALHAAGGAIAAVDAVLGEKAKSAFCALRPPGHHATPTAGMGFCIFNNAAIAAKYAQKQYGVGRVLIADWDVHHGNGTQDAFYEDASVFYMSTHQFGTYPMGLTGKGYAEEIGTGKARGTNLNVPLPPGAGDVEILDAFINKLLPRARAFGPELVIISAGFDSRMEDPLGGFNVTDNGFRALTKLMKEIANDKAHGRIVSMLEGGYDLRGLASAVCAHVAELMEE